MTWRGTAVPIIAAALPALVLPGFRASAQSPDPFQSAPVEAAPPKRAAAPRPRPKPPPAETAPAPEPAAPRLDPDLAFWQGVAQSSRPEDFDEYLRRYPQGTFASLARERLRTLRPAAAGAPRPGGAVSGGFDGVYRGTITLTAKPNPAFPCNPGPIEKTGRVLQGMLLFRFNPNTLLAGTVGGDGAVMATKTNWQGGVVFRGRIQGGSLTGEARSNSCVYAVQLQKIR